MKKFYFALVCLFFISFIQSQTIRPEFPSVNGPVQTIAKSGNTIYIGGKFTAVGPYAPYFTTINPVTGSVNYSSLVLNNRVYGAIPDGNGGWFINGSFNQVNG